MMLRKTGAICRQFVHRNCATSQWMHFCSSTRSESNDQEDKGKKLPAYSKFRMPPAMDWQDLTPGITLNRWFKKEGDVLKDGDSLCEIETPDLIFDLESDDLGYVAKLLVEEGCQDIKANQVLACIVENKEDLDAFSEAFSKGELDEDLAHMVEPLSGKENVVEDIPDETEILKDIPETAVTESSKIHQDADGGDVLRLLNRLRKEGDLEDENVFKYLKSIARSQDERILVAYEGSFDGNTFDENSFDKAFFLENIQDLVDEHKDNCENK